MLKCIVTSKKILSYLTEKPDINKQIKEKMLGGHYKGVFPLHFYLT